MENNRLLNTNGLIEQWYKQTIEGGYTTINFMIWFTNNDSYTTDKEWLWIQGYAGIGTNRTNKSISFTRDEKTIRYGSLFIKGY